MFIIFSSFSKIKEHNIGVFINEKISLHHHVKISVHHILMKCFVSLQVQEFGVTEVRDLVPNGRFIPVTEENKMDYIQLVCQMKMTGAIRQQ